MENKYFSKLTLGSALFIASCAAWFSIVGISQLFIGASIGTSVMALSLEVGKTISVSFAYRYWEKLNRIFKSIYLAMAIGLSVITSFGIYGYLMAAYTVSTLSVNDVQAKISMMDTQIQSNNDKITYNRNRISNLEKYRVQQENRIDTLIKLNKSVTQQQSVLRSNNTELVSLQDDITKTNLKTDSLMVEKSKIISTITSNSKIGTFWYVSQIIGIELDTLVKWFILLIIFVFDPLAIMLIIAYNFMVKHNKQKNDDVVNETLDETLDEIRIEPVVKTNEEQLSVEIINEPVVGDEPLVEKTIKPQIFPYYEDPEYDWDNDDKWRNDNAAIKHKKLL